MMRRLRKDNGGITLVEVIISMLILAIILVPLLSTFILSSRVNLKSRNQQYATLLGQNVMEGIKNYDLEQIALQFNGIIASGGAFSIVPATSLIDSSYEIGYYETDQYFIKITESEHQSIGKKETGEVYFKGNSEDKYYYVLNGVKEGTKNFNVRITISAQNYQGGVVSGSSIQQNRFELPDVTMLNLAETALINPSSIGIEYKLNDKDYSPDYYQDTYDLTYYSLDDAALDYFYNEHMIYQYFADLKAKASIPIPTPTSPPKLAKEQVQNKVSRKTIITIGDLNVDGEDKILVSAKLEYKLSAGEHILHEPGATDVSKATKIYGGFYENVIFDQLEQIYLFHTPFVLNKWDEDQIIIENHSNRLGSELKVFIAQQRIIGAEDGGYGNIEPIEVEATGQDISKVKFYYHNPLSDEHLKSANLLYQLNPGTNYFETLVTDGPAKDRIYEVKVQVYEAGFSELLYEINSTITR